MEMILTIGVTGTVEIMAVNILEDLWQDYLFFKENAKSKTNKHEIFHKQRYLRTSLILLFTYFEGVINNWLVILGIPEKNADSSKRYLQMSISKKYKLLFNEAMKLENNIERKNLKNIQLNSIIKAKKMRNKIIHFSPGYDGDIFHGLSDEILQKIEDEIISVINIFEELFKVQRHRNSREEVEKFSLACFGDKPDKGINSAD